MAHHGLQPIMHKACIIDEHLYDNMKEAFIDDVLKTKLPEETEQDNHDSNGSISHDADIGHADDEEGKCLFGKNVHMSEPSRHCGPYLPISLI